MITSPKGSNMIVFKGLTLIEVEDKQELSLFIDDHFILLVCLSHKLVFGDHGFELDFGCVHYDVEFTELTVS